MPQSIGRRVAISEDAPESPIAPFRRRIAVRNAELAAAYPDAAEVEARALHGIHEAINGEAVNMRGTRSAQGFRAALLGDKNITLADLCRFSTSHVREGRQAAKAAITELAAVLGYELVALKGHDMEAHENVADLSVKHSRVVAKIVTGLANDGVLDEHEARAVQPELEDLQRSIDATRAIVRRALEPKR